MKLKKITALLLSAFMAVSMVGCGTGNKSNDTGNKNAQSSSQGKNVQLLKVGTTAPVDTFNIMMESGVYGKMNYNSFSAAPFLELDNDGKIQPHIMTKWDIAEDQKSLVATFATNKGVKWHDGKPLTIDDVIFTFNFLKDVKKSGYVNTLDSVEKVSDTELKLKFSTPAAFSMLNKIARFCYVYPKHVWEKVDNYKEYQGEDAYIGCGPYKVTNIDKEAQTVTYESVGEYFKGKLTVDKVLVKSYDSHDSLVMGLRNGEVDTMYDYSNSLNATMKPSITGVNSLDAGMTTNPGHFQMVFGFNENPTKDIQFRKAVASALDYKLLATSIGGEDGEIAGTGIVSPVVKGFDKELPKNATDIEKSKKILDDAGYKDVDGDGFREQPSGEKLNVLVSPQFNKTRSALYLRICEITIENLKTVGVKAVLDEESVRNSDYASEFRKSGKYQIYIGYTSPGVALYDAAFMYMVPSVNNPWGTCSDEKFVKAYEALMNSASYDDYDKNMKILQKLASDDIIGIGLCWDKAYFPYRTDKYEGWNNYSGWGTVNCETWYNLKTK